MNTERPVNKPEFERELSDLEVTEGHSITMVCEIKGAASVSWYKDGIIQRNSSDFKQTFDGKEAKLEIGEVFLDDIGEYTCAAKNEIGEHRSTCKLNVTGKMTFFKWLVDFLNICCYCKRDIQRQQITYPLSWSMRAKLPIVGMISGIMSARSRFPGPLPSTAFFIILCYTTT